MKEQLKAPLTRRTFLAGSAVAATAAGLALAGCGGGGDTAKKEEGSGSGDAGAATGGTLTGACAYTSTNVNPIGNSSALMLAATWHVFEGLYDLDLHTYKTYNALAAGEPTKVSDTEYEVMLRDGAKFSDGTDVMAADVVNSFQKNMADATYGAFLEFISDVKEKDDKTITFTLKYPFESLLKGRLSVVKVFPASLTEDQLKTKPIGSGPWMYDTINGDDGGAIEFVPNPEYNGKYAATADKMHWDIMLDNTARTTALQEATVQVMESVPDANSEQLVAAGATVDYLQGFNQAFLMFNTQKAPFNDKRVRQAFFYAIDTDKLISNQMAGHASPVTGFLPKDHENYHEAATVYKRDVEKAKSLLAEAGVENLEFTMVTNNNWVKDLAAQIQEDLKEAGITMTNAEQKINWSEYAESDSELAYDVMLTPGDPTCFGNDPDLLMSWWYGDNIWTQGRTCWKKAGDGKFDELQTLMQQAREATGSAQQDIWNQCFDLLAEEVPLYPLFHRELATGYQETAISGFAPIATTGLVFLGAQPKM